ncbi:MaoC family dehydratase [Actinocorallia sp. A-T 12471]|uniref:MaoC family dehydratase n=1 Tax=Actinocorallia sp. A-T 12471 TaxID=3089813 RepID=UPI0029CCAEC5|nr:MaoC family dehydratase [Actinocorallia sp. A-T 12471]MDX6744952.1 MaoC family dehydratase [Actinocorallia sp. A-T 12471]
MRTFADLEEFAAAVGEELGHSDWQEITQEQVNTFAAATGDHQWIHVDPERAATESPFGTTIAHGYLTLSLVTTHVAQIFTVDSLTMVVNFGLNKVRFHTPVAVGAKVRAKAVLTDLKNSPAGKLGTLKVTIEIDGQRRPACVAEVLALYRDSA